MIGRKAGVSSVRGSGGPPRDRGVSDSGSRAHFSAWEQDLDELIAAGPMVTTRSRGKIPNTSGNTILTPVFGRSFLGALPALRADRVRVDPERLRDARPELVGLDQHRDRDEMSSPRCGRRDSAARRRALCRRAVQVDQPQFVRGRGASNASSSPTRWIACRAPDPLRRVTTSRSRTSGRPRRIRCCRASPRDRAPAVSR